MRHLERWSVDDNGYLKDKYHFAANVWFAEAFSEELVSAAGGAGVASAAGGGGAGAAGGGGAGAAGAAGGDDSVASAAGGGGAGAGAGAGAGGDDPDELLFSLDEEGAGAGGDDSDESLFSHEELWTIDRTPAN